MKVADLAVFFRVRVLQHFVLVALFFVTAFAIARLNKAPAIKDLQPEEAVEQQLSSDSEAADWWKDVGEQPAEVPQDSISAVEEQ